MKEIETWQILIRVFELLKQRGLKWNTKLRVIDAVALFKQAMMEL